MGRTRNSSKQVRMVFEELLRAPREWRHGYELSQNTNLRSGTLYPLLIRLNQQGLLEARWEQPELPGRPPRHAYRLTAKGIAYAKTSLAEAASSIVLAPTIKGSTA
jgi:DNA-binding PadR family transcriptional regulator